MGLLKLSSLDTSYFKTNKTMISIQVILAIIFIHWVADFVFQDEAWATTKSVSNKSLTKHVAMYSLIWFGTIGIVYVGYDVYWARPMTNDEGIRILLFCSITFVCHWITDYYTSRLNTKLHKAGKYGSPIPNMGFFTSIGFDQVLHYAQLFLTYLLLR